VFPSLTINDHTNQGTTYTELASKFYLSVFTGEVLLANLFYLLSCEFRASVLLTGATMRSSKSFNRMSHIFGLCYPFQVFKAIIGLVAILVIGDHSWGAWANLLKNANATRLSLQLSHGKSLMAYLLN